MQNLSSLRDSQCMPDYPQNIFVLFQYVNSIIWFFHSLPLSIELFHFFYTRALARLTETRLLRDIGWRPRSDISGLYDIKKAPLKTCFQLRVFCALRFLWLGT